MVENFAQTVEEKFGQMKILRVGQELKVKLLPNMSEFGILKPVLLRTMGNWALHWHGYELNQLIQLVNNCGPRKIESSYFLVQIPFL